MLQTVSRAVRCLVALAERGDGLRLTELAAAIGSNKATVHRIVKTLRELGFVTTTPGTSRLRLGPAVLMFRRALAAEFDLRELARPHLTWLRDQTGETACLHVPFGTERVCVEQAESQAELRWVANIGARFPLTAGAPGKVLVGFLPPAERDRVLGAVPLTRFTADSITDRSQFERALEEVRAQGYGIAVNENIPGTAACAAPVLDPGGRVVAAVTIIGSAERLTRPLLERYARLVRRAAGALSADLARASARARPAPGNGDGRPAPGGGRRGPRPRAPGPGD